MKKAIVSFALMLMLAIVMSATALAAEGVTPTVTTDGNVTSVEEGQEITFKVTLNNDEASLDATITVSGLEYVSKNGSFGDANRILMASNMSNPATYTYRVTGNAGDTVSFTLSDVKTGAGTDAPDTDGLEATYGATATITEAPVVNPPEEPSEAPEEPTTAPTDPSTTAPTEAPTESQAPATTNPPSSSGNAGSSTSAPASSDNSLDDVPHTGDTSVSVWLLAAAGCLAFAGAILAGKKAFGRR